LRRGWKILIGVVVVLAILLTLNTIVVNSETKSADVTTEGGEILELSGGDVQVVDSPAERRNAGAPIVLIHCYACSSRWWDGMLPVLNERHRVIRIDLLGHGGSEKPSGGYSMEDQAGLVAETLNELGVQGAVVVGHSLGATVATALAEQSSELVDRVVDIDQAPDGSFDEGFPFLARLAYVPVLGQLLNRVTPDVAIKKSYEEAFAPGYDIESGFENPDQVVDDFHAMTYTSFDQSADAEEDYSDGIPLDERLAAAAVPVLVIFGADDQVYEEGEALTAFEDVPGVRTATVEDAGHSPNVEQPDDTARLILEFAADAGDEAASPLPEHQGGAPGGGKGGAKKEKRGPKKEGPRDSGSS
jgi:pimeloyl-ACP methyl ester carboxylesterase